MVVLAKNDYEIHPGEVLGVDSEWSLLPEGGSISVYGGGSVKNIALSTYTYLSLEYNDDTHLYAVADGVDLTGGGILNLFGGNAYNVKWTPFSSGFFIVFDDRSEITFSTEVSGVYCGRESWDAEGSRSELLDHQTSLGGLTLNWVNESEYGYIDRVYVMAGGLLSDSTSLGGVVEVYTGGTATGITVGGSDGSGEVLVYGGTLKNTTVKDGCITLDRAGSTARDTVISTFEFSSAELLNRAGTVFDGLTVKSGSRLHANPNDSVGGEFRNVTVEKDAEAVFFMQKVTGLTMLGYSVVEVTDGILTGGITVTQSDPDAGHWLMLSESTLDFDVSAFRPNSAEPLLNNFSWIEIGSNVGYSLTVSDVQKNGIYKLAGGAAGFDQTLSVKTAAGAELGTLAVGGQLANGDYTYSLGLSDTLLTLTVSGGSPAAEKLSGDLDGDGRADVIMSIAQAGHGAEGATGAWLIRADQTAAWGDLSQRNAGWEIFGAGFTSAAKSTADVYVRSTGNVIGAWTTGDDGKVTGWETVGSFDANTQVLGLGDFNGDGQTDLLLRNVNGAVGCFFTSGEQTGWNYFQSLGAEWKITAVGDLNGDGRDDVVLKHDAGFAGSWLTQADGTMAWADLDTLQAGFSIVGAGDFDGDGTDDVLLKKDNYYGAWLVQNGHAAGWFGIGDLGGVTVEQIGDFDGDGRDDLRIRTSAGDLGAQLVKGADTLEWKYYGSVGAEWSTALAAL